MFSNNGTRDRINKLFFPIAFTLPCEKNNDFIIRNVEWIYLHIFIGQLSTKIVRYCIRINLFRVRFSFKTRLIRNRKSGNIKLWIPICFIQYPHTFYSILSSCGLYIASSSHFLLPRLLRAETTASPSASPATILWEIIMPLTN